jgi:hypothetical protein
MDRGVVSARLVIGRDLQLLSETDEGVEVEGRARLRPGRDIELVRGAGPPQVRRAVLSSWRVVRIAPDGVVFRGFCQWI